MSAASTSYGSLDDLVTASLADFALSGIDCLTKLSLLEAAWNNAVLTEAAEGAALEQLAAAGLLVREGAVYRLTDSPLHRQTLARLRDFWSDPVLHSRAAAQLRYRLA